MNKKYIEKEYVNGCSMPDPDEFAASEMISAKTLADMDRTIENFKLGCVSPAIDLSDF